MNRLTLSALALCLYATVTLVHTASPATAQQIRLERLEPPAEPADPAVEARSTDRVDARRRIHFTDILVRSPEGREALQAYHRLRKAGVLQARKGAAVVDSIGTTRDFNVLSDLDGRGGTWKELNFTLRAANDLANVWVETALDSTVDEEQMSELEASILNSTPSRSFRPDRGIIENSNEVFGSPPSGLDTDGRVDILLHDISEAAGAGCCVLGYFSPTDLNPEAPQGVGNQANVLYVDVPYMAIGGVVSIAGTIAHEYQHLIHYEYQDEQELTFVNEGLSEWAEIINGYFLRAITYLQDPERHNTALLDWGSGDFGARDPDYQRAGLFTTYLADRIGRAATGSIVQARNSGGQYAVGVEGYKGVLAAHALSLGGVVADFHTANFINDRSVDEAFGYSLPERQIFEVSSTIGYEGLAPRASADSIGLYPGAVQYVTWSDVANLNLTISDHPLTGPGARSAVNFRIIADPVGSPVTVSDLGSGVTSHQVVGDFDQVTLVASHTDLTATDLLFFDVSGAWEEIGSGGVSVELVAYDDGTADTTAFFSLDGGFRQATRFEVPANGRLTKVYLAPVYDNEFGNSTVPDFEPRDFRIEVHADDGTGRPGAVLYGKDVVDNPVGMNMDYSTFEYHYLEHDIPSDNEALQGLPDAIYVSLSNIGADVNYLALTASKSSRSDVSFLYFPNDDLWVPLSGVTTDGVTPVFPMHAFPIRAEFAVSAPVAGGSSAELPREVALSQNYPNPFNPVSRLSYSLPRSMHVSLSIYNVLGQRVTTLVEGVQPAGVHEIQVDAHGWASGVYVYTLTTEDETYARRMIVLK